MTCIHLWKFSDDLKACLQVIRLPSWPEYVKFRVKMHFLRFWTPEESVFELMTNLKLSLPESGPESFHIPLNPIFLFKFLNFLGYPENDPSHILSSNSDGKNP